MRINKLKLENFRCYERLEIDFERDLTVIVGFNGKGKTAIFDAIVVGLEPYLAQFGEKGRSICEKDIRRVPRYQKDGKHLAAMDNQFPVSVELECSLSDGSRAVSRRVLKEDGTAEEDVVALKAYGEKQAQAAAEQQERVLPVLGYYGTQRIWVDSRLMAHLGRSLADRTLGYDQCLEPSSSYSSFGRWFEHITKRARELEGAGNLSSSYHLLKQAIQKAVNTSLSSTGFGDIYYNYDLDSFVICHPDAGEMLVDHLSDGFRSVIGMVADLAYRMVRLNSFLGEKAVLETPGIVLIDEVDMHLHPLWQQTILVDLRKAFPKLQFIVTTHSPQVLSSVHAASIRVLSWGKHFEGVRYVNFSLGAKSDQLLNQIQEVSSRPQCLPIVQNLKRYLELVSEDKWDSEEALTLRKELDDWSKGNEPSLLRADMDIRMRQFRRRRS